MYWFNWFGPVYWLLETKAADRGAEGETF